VKVEIAKTEMPREASGCRIDERMPVAVKGKGPSTSAATHPGSDDTPRGTLCCRETIVSSEDVRVTDEIGPSFDHAGIGSSGSSRLIAYRSGRNVICSGKVWAA
jgi:hypothetical protein